MWTACIVPRKLHRYGLLAMQQVLSRLTVQWQLAKLECMHLNEVNMMPDGKDATATMMSCFKRTIASSDFMNKLVLSRKLRQTMS